MYLARERNEMGEAGARPSRDRSFRRDAERDPRDAGATPDSSVAAAIWISGVSDLAGAFGTRARMGPAGATAATTGGAAKRFVTLKMLSELAGAKGSARRTSTSRPKA